jgi:hypothetical protein
MAVPEMMSDRHAKSGEDMMEVLAHEIYYLGIFFLPETSACVLSQSVKMSMSDLVL